MVTQVDEVFALIYDGTVISIHDSKAAAEFGWEIFQEMFQEEHPDPDSLVTSKRQYKRFEVQTDRFDDETMEW